MTVYYACVIFVLGACLGSFYNVVGYRLPRGMSIVRPGSHCTTCNHALNVFDLFPIFSYLFLRGKCRYCGSKVKPFYPIFEALTGILFVLCYLKFGFSRLFVVGIIFVSMSLIVILSDYSTMLIPDEVLITASILLFLTDLFTVGLKDTFLHILGGFIAALLMYLLKLGGDFLFKRESMGGGDIKLMFVFGLVLGWPTAILSVFASSFIGLPVSLMLIAKSDTHEIPFGPFLCIAAIILFLTGIDMNFILDMMTR